MMDTAPADDEFVELTAIAPEDAPEALDITEGETPADEAQEGDEAEPKEGEEGAEEDPLRDKRGRYKGGAEGRIAELTRHKHDALRRAEAAEAEVAKFKGNATPNGALPGSDAAKPTPDDFEDYGEYVEALTDWKADKREAQRADTAATSAAKDASEARNAEWGAKVAAVTQALPDYEEVAGKSDINVRDYVAEAIMDADRGPELVYHLAQNPDVAERLNGMSPARAAMELGRIEAALGEPAAPPPPPAKRTTTAPAPITPVSSGSTTAKDPSKMNMDEYKAWRNNQLK